MRKINFTDKYKHAFMNCNAAQYGKGGADIAKLASDLREWNDVRTGSNTLDSSKGDNYANKVGGLLGSKYPKVCSLVIIGIVSGISFYLCADYSYRKQAQQQIKECIDSGFSEETCKNRIF